MNENSATTKGIFAYRQHSDGTIAAICLRCYANAATANTLSRLALLEGHHRCGDASGGKVSISASTLSAAQESRSKIRGTQSATR
jgi:hypothetical protein